jgi:hypothetical protein
MRLWPAVRIRHDEVPVLCSPDSSCKSAFLSWLRFGVVYHSEVGVVGLQGSKPFGGAVLGAVVDDQPLCGPVFWKLLSTPIGPN